MGLRARSAASKRQRRWGCGVGLGQKTESAAVVCRRDLGGESLEVVVENEETNRPAS